MAGRTNEVSMSYAEEVSTGTLPGSPVFKYIEPNDIGTYGATLTTKARNPISNTRGAKKGAIVDLDSAVEFGADMTLDSVQDFAKGFMYASWYEQLNFEPTAVVVSAFTVAADGDLTADTLVYARNFLNSGNNGLFVVGAGSTGTSIVIDATLIAETTPPDSAEVDVVGVQGADSDIEIDAEGNLISTVLDFTTLDIIQGQGIYIGGDTTVTQFATAAGGYARCRLIEAHKITLDKTIAQDTDAGASKTIQLFFGSFIRDVATNDAKFGATTYQFEMRIPGLDEGTSYEYAKGNICNTANFSLATADFATTSFTFIGTDTDVPTTTRKTATWVDPSLTTALSTTADVANLRLALADETSLTSYTKSLDIAINNNATPEKAVGVLGAVETSYGDFVVTGSTEVLYENDDIITAIRNNETVTLDFVIANDNGAIWVDIPSMTLGSGNKSFPENEIIKISLDGNAFEDTYYGFSLGFTKFPYVPGQDD